MKKIIVFMMMMIGISSYAEMVFSEAGILNMGERSVVCNDNMPTIPLTYSDCWDNSASGVTSISINGKTVISETGEGIYNWSPQASGVYELQHKIGEDITDTIELNVSISYSVKFNANGGSGTMSTQTYAYGEEQALSANTFTRAGYTFAGWATSASGPVVYDDCEEFLFPTTTTPNKVVTLYAIWTPIKYAVRFNANGGTGTMQNQVFSFGETQALTLNAFTYSGKIFSGWSLEPDSEAFYADGEKVCDLTTEKGGVINLYAVWGNVSNVFATQRYPWNNLVDISYKISGTLIPNSKIEITAVDIVTGEVYYPKTFNKTPPITVGSHNVVWDMDADGININSNNIKIGVSIVPPDMTYMVIDISAGHKATKYPISYMSSRPSGGWSDTYKTSKLVFRRIPAGTYKKGSRWIEDYSYDEGGYYTYDELVKIPEDFYIGVFEITQKQANNIDGSTWNHLWDEIYVGDTLPVSIIKYRSIRGYENGAVFPPTSAVDSNSIVGKLRTKTGLHIDLPTDDQWEYAARAGSDNDYGLLEDGSEGSWSDLVGYEVDELNSVPVGSYLPNAWGVYDMNGGCPEWCLDGPSKYERYARGGCWYHDDYYCTCYSWHQGCEQLHHYDENGNDVCLMSGEGVSYRLVAKPQYASTKKQTSYSSKMFLNTEERAVALDASPTIPIVASKKWNTSLSGNLSIIINSKTVYSGTSNRIYDWTPTEYGTYTLIVKIGSTQVYKTLFDITQQYTVRFNANGGIGDMENQIIFSGKTVALSANAFNRTGFSFAGWSTTPYGTVAYANCQSVKDLTLENKGIVDLFAVWDNPLPIAMLNTLYSQTLPSSLGDTCTWFVGEDKYKETLVTKSFSSVGSATGHQVDDGYYTYNLPFAFPFFGEHKTRIYINSNGTINFTTDGADDYRESEASLKSRPMIAVLWDDLTTLTGNVYIKESSDYVTIRWNGGYYDTGEVNFSATLYKSGKIVLSYGSGNANGGLIGVSKGDDSHYLISSMSNTGSMNNAKDIVLNYMEKKELPFNFTLSTNGVFSGKPTSIGEYVFGAYALDTSTGNMLEEEYCLVVRRPWYTVRYNANGASGVMYDEQFDIDASKNLSKNTYTRDGYVFKGWSKTSSGSVTYSDGQSVKNLTTANTTITLYAVWQGVPYAVKFNANGGSGSMSNQSFTYGTSKALTSNNFTKTGYAFKGWATNATGSVVYTNGQTVNNLTSIANTTINLYAVWEPISYSIRFNANGGSGSMSNQSYTYGETKNLTSNAFTRPGYVFTGWAKSATGSVVYTNSQSVKNLTTTLNGVVNLYAVWTPIKYAVRFNANGGSGSMSNQSFTYGVGKALSANVFSRQGYSFDGWTIINPAEKPTYVVIDLSSGASATSYPVSYLDSVPAGGWTDEYKTTKLVLRKITAGSMPGTSGVSLSEDYYVGIFELTQKQWELVMGTSPSNWSGNTLPVESVSYDEIRGATLGAQWPASNDVDASSFMGKLRAKTGLKFDLPTEAQWEYAARAGSVGSYGYVSGTTEGTLANMAWYSGNSSSITHNVGTKTPNAWGFYDMLGNVFEWCLDWYGTSYTGADPVGSSSGTLRVRRGGSWGNGASYCTVGMRSNYGTTPETKSSYFGFRVALSNLKDMSVAMYEDKQTVLNLTLEEGAIVDLYAIWAPHTYSIKYNSNGGSGYMSNQSITYDEETALKENQYSRTGYKFIGWSTSTSGNVSYTNKETVINLSKVDGATINLYAVWEKIPIYTIRFYSNGGSGTMSNQVLEYDCSTALRLNTFTREGYTFCGWSRTATGDVVYSDAQTVINLTSTDGAIVNLYAVWEPISYSIRFNANGGSGSMSNQSFTYGTSKALTSNNFTKTGYAFTGWATNATGSVVYTNGQSVNNLTTTLNGVVNLYAVWEPISYSIRYNANGGSGSMSNQSFTYGTSKALTSNNFTKTGYAFTGWATNATGSVVYTNGQTVNNLTTTANTTINLYAVWEPISYSIRFNANGGSGSMSNQSFTYGTSKTLTSNNFTKTGYAFTGWATNATGSVVYTNSQSVNNLTTKANDIVSLYAVWSPNSYEVKFNSNGGVGEMPNQSFTYGDSQPLTANTFTREGYNFAGWSIINPTEKPTYVVIDLSSGASATSYPVSYLDSVPAGGWTDEYKTTKLVLRKITAGSMPGTSGVSLSEDYYVGIFELTQKQWELVMGISPSKWSGNTLPVESVSYDEIRGATLGAQWPASNDVDASSFMGKLRAKTGLKFDLPTEAQWEYAARAGSVGSYGYVSGTTEGTLANMAWYSGNSSSITHNVGTKTPNAWGVYDMLGNVFEWCLDWYGTSYTGADPVGSSSGTLRVRRGGSWGNGASYCTVGMRSNYGTTPETKSSYFGFRVVLSNIENFASEIYQDEESVVDLTTENNGVVVLNAVWNPISYSIRFNSNGGTGSMANQSFTYGETKTLTANAFTCSNAAFVGWSTSEGGSVIYMDSQAVSNLTSIEDDVVDLYASWAGIENVKLTQRYPWNNKVDIDYTIIGDASNLLLSLVVKDNVSGKVYVPKTFDKTPSTTEGSHRITWDPNADGITFTSTDAVVGVSLSSSQLYTPSTYMVIDLSGGTSASKYSVTYLDTAPAGGWTDEYKTTKLVLRRIVPGGMPGNANISLTSDYYIGVFEVTQKQWSLVKGTSPSYYKGNLLPVEKVSYNDIRGTNYGSKWPANGYVDSGTFIHTLRNKTGLTIDLPTEAQWEYAARAGGSGDYGLLDSGLQGEIADMGWYDANGEGKSHNVGLKTPNAWGLYDMHGNVWEWCLDWHGASTYVGVDPVGASSGVRRVYRGGGFGNGIVYSKSSYRGLTVPTTQSYSIGLRLAVRMTGISGSEELNISDYVLSDSTYLNIGERVFSSVCESMPLTYSPKWIETDSGEASIVINEQTVLTEVNEGVYTWQIQTPGEHTLVHKIGNVVTDTISFDVPSFNYTIRFNANGGSGEMEEQVFTYGTEQALTANSFENGEFNFAGWATNATGSVVYTNGQTVVNLTTNANKIIDLYAVWSGVKETQTTEVPVPYEWLDEYVTDASSDYEVAANMLGANGIPVWKSYVAGLDPEDANSKLLVYIEMEEEMPIITWAPDLGEARKYTIEGKSKLDDELWISPTNSSHRFFRIKVELK